MLAREVGYVRKPHGGRLRVALAFPNTYYVGMSSLGFQTVYRLFNNLETALHFFELAAKEHLEKETVALIEPLLSRSCRRCES